MVFLKTPQEAWKYTLSHFSQLFTPNGDLLGMVSTPIIDLSLQGRGKFVYG